MTFEGSFRDCTLQNVLLVGLIWVLSVPKVPIFSTRIHLLLLFYTQLRKGSTLEFPFFILLLLVLHGSQNFQFQVALLNWLCCGGKFVEGFCNGYGSSVLWWLVDF